MHFKHIIYSYSDIVVHLTSMFPLIFKFELGGQWWAHRTMLNYLHGSSCTFFIRYPIPYWLATFEFLVPKVHEHATLTFTSIRHRAKYQFENSAQNFPWTELNACSTLSTLHQPSSEKVQDHFIDYEIPSLASDSTLAIRHTAVTPFHSHL